MLTTYEAGVAMLDFEEFRSFKTQEGCIVTSVPVTEVGAKGVLDMVERYQTTPLRFNFLKQGCPKFVAEVLLASGCKQKIDMKKHLIPSLFNSLPKWFRFPFEGVGRLVGRPKKTMGTVLPNPVKRAIQRVAAVVLFVPGCTVNFLGNLLVFAMGGARMAPPKKGIKLERPNLKRMNYFPRLLDSWKDMFRSNNANFLTSFPFIQWQLRQQSTMIHRYEGQPKLRMLPPEKEGD